MDYDLARLGSREFEHMVQALVLSVLGARVEVFGDGPDGGREATYNGRVRWDQHDDVWTGYTVVQAKCISRQRGTEQETRWLLGQLRNELTHWSDPESQRRKKGRLPENLLIVSNAVLSPTEGGGIEQVNELVQKYAEDNGLRDWQVWHYDKLCRLLDVHESVRRAFSGLITVGDILARLEAVLNMSTAELGGVLSAHAAKTMLADQSVRLQQAGAPMNERLALASVAVDLPSHITDAGDRVLSRPTIASIVQHADAVWRPSVVGQGVRPHIVLVGGPGQGKTTLGQLLAQTYRVSLLEGIALPNEAARVRQQTRDRLDDINVPVPRSKRWTVRVELAPYGDAIGGGANISLLRWVASDIAERDGVDVTGADLRDWLARYPWLVVLDGLDEVAALPAREQVKRQVSNFLIDAAQVDADLVVVATTRPQGYGGEFSRDDFTEYQMMPLTTDQALEYAARLAELRLSSDPDSRTDLLQRVRQAADDPLTKRLMRTPLQVTIMSLLLERLPRPPQERHALFDAYYETVYARESAKPGFLAKFLDDHKAHVNAFHEQVGLRLQVLAESAGDSEAVLPREQMREVVVARLAAEGYEGDDAQRLMDDITRAATERLVLLVPKGEDGVGFEVRTLQEFMAGRALVNGTQKDVIERLRLAACSAHWRNTWLLAVGRIFATAEYLRPQVVQVLRELDAASLLALVVPPGPELAFELLDDDIAVRSPNIRRQLLAHALAALDGNVPPPAGLGRGLHDLGDVPSLRALITAALEKAWAGGPAQHAAALGVLMELEQHTGPLAANARRLLATRQATGEDIEPRPRLWNAIKDNLTESQLDPDVEPIVNTFVQELRPIRLDFAKTPPPLSPGPGALAVVENENAGEAVAVAVLDIPPEHWGAAAAVSQLLFLAVKRRPTGEKLLALIRAQRETAL